MALPKPPVPRRRPPPRVHGRDHEHGAADPTMIHYEDVGAAGTGGGVPVIPFSVFGTLAVQTGQLRWYAANGGTITEVHASVGTPPAGSGTTVRVNRNGSSIGTVTIAAGANTNTFTPSTATFSAGDYFTIDITAVGSTTAGSDLVVQLRIA